MEWGRVKETAAYVVDEIYRLKILDYATIAICLFILGLLVGQYFSSSAPRSRRSVIWAMICYSLTLLLVVFRVFILPHLIEDEN